MSYAKRVLLGSNRRRFSREVQDTHVGLVSGRSHLIRQLCLVFDLATSQQVVRKFGSNVVLPSVIAGIFILAGAVKR
jgi:hypothetical protein